MQVQNEQWVPKKRSKRVLTRKRTKKKRAEIAPDMAAARKAD
jgi:hypothetical protein